MWPICGIALAGAIFAGVAEHHRVRRRDLDRMGVVSWPLVQFLLLAVAAISGGLALGLIHG